MKVLIIIPAYNEQENIINTVSKVLDYKTECDFQLDYVVINDGSKDNTYDICRKTTYGALTLYKTSV